MTQWYITDSDLCAPFNVKQGIRQGCALSAMLYILSIELLLIRLGPEINSIVIPKCNQAFHLSAYADKVVIPLSG